MRFRTSRHSSRRTLLIGLVVIIAAASVALVMAGCGAESAADTGSDPKIENVALSVDGTTATVRWQTDVVATGIVRYRPATGGAENRSDATAPSTQHVVTLEGLEPATEYSLAIDVSTESGDVATSSGLKLTTRNPGESGPQILNTSANVTGNSVAVEVTANESVAATLSYGQSEAQLSASQESSDPDTKHRFLLLNLKAGTSYFWRVVVTDLDGNRAETEVKAFETGGTGGGGKTDEVTEINLNARQWEYSRDPIRVAKGTKVRLTMKSLDVPHGFALNAFGINKQINPGATVVAEFVANRAGKFQFFCTVPCGAGHADMNGTLIVE